MITSLESILMLAVMSIITPLITSSASAIVSWIMKIIDYLKEYINNDNYNSVEVEYVAKYDTKDSRTRGIFDTTGNDDVIRAILLYISNSNIINRKIACSLNCGNTNLDGTQYLNSKSLDILPKYKFNCKEFIIAYSDNRNMIDAGKEHLITTKKIIVKSKKTTQEIKDFIEKCYKEYIFKTSLEATYDGQPYFYKQNICDENRVIYRKILVDNMTSFDDIFIPDKDIIIRAANKFKENKIKKLSLLLHGAPGCGKTSIIRALANYLGFSIIEVKLSLLDDGIIADIFHNSKLRATNGAAFHSSYVPLNKRIYVFEDIDAECDIVHKRNENVVNKNSSASPVFIINSATNDNKELTNNPSKKLTLSGVLNALDGVLELNTVIIMTTNHVAKLDDALIRPGRVTKAIELKKMTSRDASLLIAKYFGANHDINIADYTITPADLDAICQISDSVEDVKRAIKK